MTTSLRPNAGTLRRMCGLLLVTASLSAHAVLITFDERARVPGTDGGDMWYSDPITNEYTAWGVNIFDGYLVGEPGRQRLLGGPAFTITFTGTLPTYVNLEALSPVPDNAAWVTASGPGYGATYGTGGLAWSEVDNDLVVLPGSPGGLARFHSEQGIQQLSFSTYASTRWVGLIDNLYVGNVAAIPEPATLALWAAGLGVVAVAKRRRRHAA